MRILTHNIRYATSSPFPGEAPWPQRRPRLLAELDYHTRHDPEALICLQEVLHWQLVDILNGLNDADAVAATNTKISCPSRTFASEADLTSKSSSKGDRSRASKLGEEDAWRWDFYGVGRDDGLEKGEYSPVFYRPRAWRKMAEGTIWLSQTPGVPGSKGWDAASVRICTVLVLEKRSGDKISIRRKGGPGDALGCSGQKQRGSEEEEGFVVVGKLGSGDCCGGNSAGNGDQVATTGEEGWDAVAEKDIEREEAKQCAQKEKPNLKQNSHGKRLLVLNTHLDDQGLISRQKSAQLILACIPGLRTKWKVDGVVLAGDLNSEATDEENCTFTSDSHTDIHLAAKPLLSRESRATDDDHWEETEKKNMKDDGHMQGRELAWTIRKSFGQDAKKLHFSSYKQQEDAWTILNAPGSGMKDMRSFIHSEKRYGHSMTFTGFDGCGDADKRCKRIDFIHIDTGLYTTGNAPNDRGESKENGSSDVDSQQQLGKQERGREQEKLSDSNETSQQKDKDQKTLRSPWRIQGYAVLPNIFDDGVYISDHRAVVADMVLE